MRLNILSGIHDFTSLRDLKWLRLQCSNMNVKEDAGCVLNHLAYKKKGNRGLNVIAFIIFPFGNIHLKRNVSFPHVISMAIVESRVGSLRQIQNWIFAIFDLKSGNDSFQSIFSVSYFVCKVGVKGLIVRKSADLWRQQMAFPV